MVDEYDKPLHSPLKWKTMETRARDFDEARLDAAIADILQAENADEPAVAEEKVAFRPEFPDLAPQEQAEPQMPEPGVAATLRQKWAELSGAA